MGSEGDGPRHPFFIVGSARSGTTLLRLMLNAHPEVAIPPESRFITELHPGHARMTVENFLAKLARHKRFETWDLPIEAVAAEIGRTEGEAPYAELLDATYRAYARAQGKHVWGDKTPRYVESLPTLAQLWPDAHFIHLIRDGRDVALSYADVSFGPKTVGRAARLWASRVRAGLSAGRRLGDDTYREFRYEELVADPEGQLRAIASFIGADFNAAMLDYTERARSSVLSRAQVYNPNVTRPPSKTRSWQKSMRDRDVEIFEAVAGDLLSVLGYERRYANPRLLPRVTGHLGAVGLPIGRIRT